MKKACVKGDAKCLKTAQEAEVKALKAKLAKFTHKPTILKHKVLKLPKVIVKKPEFSIPKFRGGEDFVDPEYKPNSQSKTLVGLPLGWSVPMTKARGPN